MWGMEFSQDVGVALTIPETQRKVLFNCVSILVCIFLMIIQKQSKGWCRVMLFF